jgi:hypothetical protein
MRNALLSTGIVGGLVGIHKAGSVEFVEPQFITGRAESANRFFDE